MKTTRHEEILKAGLDDELEHLKDIRLEVDCLHDKLYVGVRETAASVPVSPGHRPYLTEIKAILEKRIGEIEDRYLKENAA